MRKFEEALFQLSSEHRRDDGTFTDVGLGGGTIFLSLTSSPTPGSTPPTLFVPIPNSNPIGSN